MGKVNTANFTYYDDEKTFLVSTGQQHDNVSNEAKENEQMSAVGEDGEEIEVHKGLTVSFELYSKFWKLQASLPWPNVISLLPEVTVYTMIELFCEWKQEFWWAEGLLVRLHAACQAGHWHIRTHHLQHY